MANPGLTKDEAQKVLDTVETKLRAGHPPPGINRKGVLGAVRATAQDLGRAASSGGNLVAAATRVLGREPNWALYGAPGSAAPIAPLANPAAEAELPEKLLRLLRKEAATLDELAERIGRSRGQVLDAMDYLRRQAHSVTETNGRFSIVREALPGFMADGDLPTYVSRPDNTFLFGACGDNHLGSKYARLDVLNALYDRYAEEGVDRVYNTGNWIDGEARFNKHDLIAHGVEGQLNYLREHYPQRAGINTYAVSGDDHEGWYAQSFGINIGKRAEQAMREIGRTDWHDLGYMEAHIRLVNANTGKASILAVVHPGGGSSYAVSYSIQKIIESLDGGEKPAVGLYGHYHKLWAGNIRNVWVTQTGTTEDQTPFMRKKKLEAHVGGTLIKLHQDPETGAIVRFQPELMRFFNKGFYNNRWSHSDGVQHAERGV